MNAIEVTPMPSAHRFPKDRRVRRRGEFQEIFQRGMRVQGRYFTVLMLPNGRSGARLGIVASRKFGGAVQRNRAKRLIREIFRHLDLDGAPSLDVVVIPRRELLDVALPTLTQDFRNIWRRGAGRAATHDRR